MILVTKCDRGQCPRWSSGYNVDLEYERQRFNPLIHLFQCWDLSYCAVT